MLKRLRQHFAREARSARYRIACTEHPIDLKALERFVADRRPDADARAAELIAGGRCPTCQEQYVGVGGFEKAAWLIDGRLQCTCCGSLWAVEPDGWTTQVGDGLEIVGADAELPVGVDIDSSSFQVVALDDLSAIERVLRTELMSTPGLPLEQEAVRAVVNDIIEGVVAASRGEAIEGAEIWRSITEGGLDGPTASILEGRATDVLADIHRLLDTASVPGSEPVESAWTPEGGREEFEGDV